MTSHMEQLHFQRVQLAQYNLEIASLAIYIHGHPHKGLCTYMYVYVFIFPGMYYLQALNQFYYIWWTLLSAVQ